MPLSQWVAPRRRKWLGPRRYFNKANGIGYTEAVYFPIGWKRAKGGEREEVRRDLRQAMIEPSVHRDPRIINIDDLRPLFGPDGAPLLGAIAPVYEPAGRSAASSPLSFSSFLFPRITVGVCCCRSRGRRRRNAFSVTRDVTV